MKTAQIFPKKALRPKPCKYFKKSTCVRNTKYYKKIQQTESEQALALALALVNRIRPLGTR
jgi:hypothetical protein